VKLLLTSTASYDPPKGGSTRANLAWVKHLAANGHEIRLVAGADSPTRLRREIEEFQPDWVLVSSEDLAHSLLREAFRTSPDRIVYLAHTPQFFPFGPQSWNPESDATDLIRRAAAVIVISQSVADYVDEHLGRKVEVIHPPMYDSATLCQNPNGAVTMINPCAVKGLPIFLALADRLPNIEFHALRGWGTTADDEAQIRRRPNIELIETVADIEEELRRTKVLLMPSLWFEGFGLIVMEAMLRGIPVIASDAGGLVEAKLGTRFIIPVRPIQQFEPEFDDRHMPVPIVPEQNIDAWVAALESVTPGDAAHAREAAVRFVNGLDPAAFERMLLGLQRVEAKPVRTITPEQRALLLRKLRQKG
jgi:glycosyltransferase involved in cell wall biosynthesis